MANERIRGFVPFRGESLPDRLGLGRRSAWRGASSDASIPFTPPSSRTDPAAEHDLREEVEECVLRGDFPAAQRAIGTRLAAGSFLDTALHLLGVVRLVQGDAASACDCLKQALSLRSTSPEQERLTSTRNALARVAMHREDYEEAWAQLDRALALDPISLHLHWNRLCVARDELARSASVGERARERFDSALRAMVSIDPEWRDEAGANPFLLSLK